MTQSRTQRLTEADRAAIYRMADDGLPASVIEEVMREDYGTTVSSKHVYYLLRKRRAKEATPKVSVLTEGEELRARAASLRWGASTNGAGMRGQDGFYFG